ncbi:hypothetical protein [Lutibacter sp.]|uniref:hypothetical protein n=1 Tax=Lutibacter sp. TaxID=1925666 RepID=UPI00273526D3|nr:hypothetical protein [Lutibacter sp.]MDP3312629.1 hypothetical protein [Lutibacter sp.]
MTFKQRLPYFLGGLTIGIIVVVFFLGKKETTFDYGPNARVLKNISTKKLNINAFILEELSSHKLDTSTIYQILKNGDVDLGNKIKNDSCISYTIEGEKELQHITIKVNNCPKNAFVEKIHFK